MYEIFRRTYRGNNTTFPIMGLPQLRNNLKTNYTSIASYYRKQENKVDYSHLLVTLIEYANISTKRDDYGIIVACMERGADIAKRLGLVHPENSNPQTFTGVFYNNQVSEVLVLQDVATLDIQFVREHWYNINCTTISTHPYNDINGGLCNGKYPSSTSGYSVIYINLPLMMLIYKYWCIDRLRRNFHDNRPEYFVYQVVIPNMILNHIDIATINRAISMYKGNSLSTFQRLHPVTMMDCTELIDKAISSQIKALDIQTVNPYNFFSLFNSIMYNRTWREVMNVPDIVPNMNVRWAMELSVLPYIEFFVYYYSKTTNPQIIRSFTNGFRRTIKSMETSKECKHLIHMGGSSHYTNLKNKLSMLPV